METGNLEEDVCSVVAQESQALVEVLCSQRHDILRNLCSLVTDQPALEDLRQLTNLRECATRLVGHFKTAEPVKCAEFLQALCMSCENMPMLLESQLMCAAGCVTGAVCFFLTLLIAICDHSVAALWVIIYGLCHCFYTDHVQNYVDAVKTLLLQKYKRVTQDVVREVHLHETWVSLQKRTSSRNRVDRIHGQDGEDSSVECRVTVESLLGNSGQVIVLLGQAGSGKTLLMHCLGHRWAQGAFPSFHLLFLLEFRQLNLVGQPLSLKELLFRFVLPPSSEDQGEEVLDFISSNPEKVCLIFDGYDEFRTKFANPDKLSSALDSSTQLPIAELLSGLCSQKILSKCTLLVTCRPRDVTYMFHNSGYIGELLGFDQKSIQEYTEQFFQGKDRSICERAITHLMTSRHLLTMCHVPALCHICCVCLDHLFSTNGWQNSLQLPRTLTQIYLQILSAFLHRNSDKSSSETVGSVLQRFRSEIRWLGSLAMEGLEDRRIVFEIEESPLCFTDFATRVGILCQVDLNFEGRYRSLVYSFMHLTMQEFLGAVHLMTSESVTDAAFKKKLALKTRWAAKNEPKMVFTDSIQLFLCGLASSDCMPYLILLAGDNAEARLRKRQSTVLKVLESFAGNANLTGPKIVELCRCTHETQDVALAMKVGSRQRFELRNIRVNPVDLDALAFVISAAEGNAILDFGGCSLEPECLDVLPNCKKVESLIFHSRKYDDKFAQSLSGIIPKLQTLKQLEFTNCSLTDDGATKLIHALKECPMIEKINLSGNILTNKSLKLIVDTLPRLLNLRCCCVSSCPTVQKTDDTFVI
uniref:NACHT domain-containing protein n=1 Tax=Denticeps clupeoides TaxID=299321 RepID=A0AAY4DSZ0_9TELE